MNVDQMLDGMEAWQLTAEWPAFEAWEREMEQRAVLQAKANAGVEAMKTGAK